MIARTDNAGRITKLIRDLRGQIIERRRSDGIAIDFSYDSIGRMTKAGAPGSELEFGYDAIGQIVFELQNGNVIKHEYDPLGRRVKRLSPSGQSVEFIYDANSQLSRLNTPRGSIEFEYDKAGRVAKRSLPGSLEERFYYDSCGRLTEQSLHKLDQILTYRGYKYDAEGNLIELSDSSNGVSLYAYDRVERLREVLQPEKKVERLIYDATGNLLSKGERTFRYDESDRLTQTDDAKLVYDNLGNLVEKRRGGSVIRYSYDTENRLIVVESKEGGRIEFAYDAFGRRIAKSTQDGETGFLWDGDVLLSERHCELSSEYVFSLNAYEPICRFDEERLETYHNDHLGTPRELTDELGRVVWSANYDVYGRVSSLLRNKTDSQIRFQGQYEDVETGLYYNYFRYYDPDAGRFINNDPIGINGGMNQYVYSPNPVNWIDPWGFLPS